MAAVDAVFATLLCQFTPMWERQQQLIEAHSVTVFSSEGQTVAINIEVI